MHDDAIAMAETVVLVDDLIAAGDTAAAGVQLRQGAGAKVLAARYIVDPP